jgi:hypothetical protein
MENFEGLMNEEMIRDEIIEACMEKIIVLSETKSKLIHGILNNL